MTIFSTWRSTQLGGRLLPLALAISVLAGCSTQRPQLFDGRTAAFEKPALSSVEPFAATWWRQLNNPELNALVDEALTHNFTVQAAAIRLKEAAGADRSAIWGLLPTSSINRKLTGMDNPRYETNGVSFGGPPKGIQTTNTASFGVSWELPLFGRGQAVLGQAKAQANAAFWSLAAAKVAVASELVRAYEERRGLLCMQAYLRDDIKLLDALIRAEDAVVAKGLSTGAEVRKLEAQQLDLRSRLRAGSARISQLEAKLNTLRGSPVKLILADLSTRAPGGIPEVPLIRAETIRLRPDVRAAEQSVAVAAARLGMASASLWPQFSLGGEMALTKGNLDAYGSSRGLSSTINANVGLHIPLLDWFALKADADAKKLEMEAVVLDYRQTVLSAWEEANATYEDFAAAKEKQTFAMRTVEISKTEVSRQASFLRAGVGSKQEVLKAQLAENERAVQELEERFAALQAWARLIKATFYSEKT